MRDLDIQVAIPSRDRTQNMAKMLRIFPDALIFVAEKEHEAYAKVVPKKQLVTHPNLVGLGKIRNFMCDTVKKEIIVFVDDDLNRVVAWTGQWYRVLSSEDVHYLIRSTATLATDAGLSIFGWSNFGRPTYLKHNKPISFKGPISRAFGLVGRKIRWDERLIGSVDTDATLQALMEERIILMDDRFYWDCGRILGNKGGLQSIRTSENRTRDIGIMRSKWGDCFCLQGNTGGTPKNSIRVER